MGFALGFDIPDDKAIEISYTKDRPLFTWDGLPPPKDSQRYLDKLMKTKYISWRYEAEVRTVYKLNTLENEPDDYFNKFDDALILKEVIAGCNSRLSDGQFREMLDGYKNIVAIKSRMDLKSYKIVRNEQKVWKLT